MTVFRWAPQNREIILKITNKWIYEQEARKQSSSREWSWAGIEEFPNIEAVQKYTADKLVPILREYERVRHKIGIVAKLPDSSRFVSQ
jgi:hypothetical protein